MNEFVGLAFLTCVAFQFVQFVYVSTQAFVGIWAGATVEAVSVGIGPVILRRSLRGIEWRFCLIPGGGSTQYYSLDRLDGEIIDDATPFTDLSILRRVVTLLSGPFSSITIGLVLAMIPVTLGASAIAVDQAAEPIFPSAVPHLGVAHAAATIETQKALFENTFVEFWRGLHFIRGDEGWGGLFGCWMTCTAALRVSVTAWMSCFGVFIIGLGAYNLVPFPTLNGGQIVLATIEFMFGRPSEKFVHQLMVIGLLTIVVFLVLLIRLDVLWYMSRA